MSILIKKVISATGKNEKQLSSFRKFRFICQVFLGLIMLFDYAHAQITSRQPNVVFILVDDLGWADLGYMGSKTYETPNVDRLAAEGMSFMQFYSGGPVCSPGRATIMTGKSTARTGITAYLITPEKDPDYITHHLELSEFTIGEAFQKHGYATGYFGKWHLGYKQQYWASHQGFDIAIGGATSSNAWKEGFPGEPLPIPAHQLETYYFSPYYFTHMKDGPVGEYLTDRLTNETIKFIEDHKNQPFFAFLSFHTVHTPLVAKREIEARFRKKINEMGLLGKDDMEYGSRKYQNLPEYAAMVYQMDQNVGRLMHKLDSLGLRENTIVVFTSDNGGKGSVTSNAPLRGCKHNLYEGGIRVPFILRWPRNVKPGSENNTPLTFADCYPTLLDLAGLLLEPQQHVDGLSFKEILTGKQNTLDRNVLCWHYPHGVFQGAVRFKNFKLVYHYKTGESELFDLRADIGERNDISAKNEKIVSKMKMILRNWLIETNARFPDHGIIKP